MLTHKCTHTHTHKWDSLQKIKLWVSTRNKIWNEGTNKQKIKNTVTKKRKKKKEKRKSHNAIIERHLGGQEKKK